MSEPAEDVTAEIGAHCMHLAIDFRWRNPIIMEQRLSRSFIRLHVLHHASHEAIFGLGIIEELAHHGYKLGPGTLYPILHSMERDGLLKSSSVRAGRTARRTYLATAKGKTALRDAKRRVWELVEELFEDELSHGPLAKAVSRKKTLTKTG